MEPTGKKPPRDLSDLKARLGLDKGGDKPRGASGLQPAVGAPPTTASHPVVGTAPAVPVVGGAGVPPAAPRPPEPDRDPFGAAGAALVTQQASRSIVDAGPRMDIPVAKKSHLPLIGMVAGLLLAGLIAGYLFGNISHARLLFNHTLKDAKRIQDEITKVSELDQKVMGALAQSRRKKADPGAYDAALVAELKEVLASPLANPMGVKRLENSLFRTNYAMMDDLLISQLFGYFNNTLRLISAVSTFVDYAASHKDDIVAYAASGEAEQRKYGLVLAQDRGTFFLGSLVEVGRPTCDNRPAMEAGTCKRDKVTGFEVRPPNAPRWVRRAGKPSKKTSLTDIVIPIIPDHTWQSVASAKRGYVAHSVYVQRRRAIERISTLLVRDRKPLLESLKKQASHQQLTTL